MADTPPVLLNAPHDWRTAYNIKYDFSTEVLQSDDGTEQRIALRYMPVKQITFSPTTIGEDSRRLRAELDFHMNDNVAIAQWPTYRPTAAAIVPGSSIVTFADGRPYWAVTGSYVILVSGDRLQLFEIIAVNPNAVQVSPAISGAAWPVGTRVQRAVIGQPINPSMLSFTTAGVGQHTITFDVDPESELGLDYDNVRPQVYNGKEFFDPDLDWSNTLGLSFSQLTEDVYFNRGVRNRYSRMPFGLRTMQARTYFAGDQGGDPWLQFFMRCRGRQVPFYMSTGQPDILPVADLLASDTSIRHQGLWLKNMYQGSTVFKHIQVLLRDGTKIRRPVVNILTEGVDISAIDTGSPWPRTISLSEILMVSWVTCCRLASDTMILEYQTQNVGSIGLSVQTLVDE